MNLAWRWGFPYPVRGHALHWRSTDVLHGVGYGPVSSEVTFNAVLTLIFVFSGCLSIWKKVKFFVNYFFKSTFLDLSHVQRNWLRNLFHLHVYRMFL